MTSLLVITNAAAGSADAEAVEDALAVLRPRADVVVAATETPQECAAALAKRAGRQVVVGGGDGSIHAVVAALHAADDLTDPVGVIPLGTGNDLARAVGIPLDPTAAAVVVLDGSPRELDLILSDNGEIVVNAVHVGVGAEAARTASGLKPLLGKLAYAVGGLAAGAREPGWRLLVQVDGVTLVDHNSRVLQVGLGIGTSVGGGSLLTPHASPDDGLADVVVSLSVGPLARIGYGLRMPRGGHVHRPDVHTARGRIVSVSGDSFRYNTDGEIRGPVDRRTWTVHPATWRLLVPQPSAASGSTEAGVS